MKSSDLGAATRLLEERRDLLGLYGAALRITLSSGHLEYACDEQRICCAVLDELLLRNGKELQALGVTDLPQRTRTQEPPK